jgi:type I restriction enzyme S subunit
MKYRIKDLISEKLSGEWGNIATGENDCKILRTTNFTNLGSLNYENVVSRNIDVKKADQKRLKIGDIIIEKSGGSPSQPVGRVVFFELQSEEKYLCNNFTAILRPNIKIVYPKYLLYQLHLAYKRGITLRYQNKTTGIINLKLDKFLEEKINVPPLSDQIHIANILSQAEKLIAQRKESIRLLDEFLKSTFLEMFGNPVRNEKEFDKGRFGDFVNAIVSGSSYGGEQKENLKDDEFGVLKISAVTWGVFNPKEFKVVNKVDLRGQIIHPAKGDLLFSRANTKELVGATCIVDADYPKLFLPDKIWNIKLKETELNKVYVHYLFKNSTFRNILTQDATGTSGSMLNISMEKLRNLKFPKPPISLQTQFAQIVEKTEALKTHYQLSLQELENLYGSLSQRAFKGELTVKDGELLMAAEAKTAYKTKQ